MKLVAAFLLAASTALPAGAQSSDVPENTAERRYLEFSDRMQRLMQKYEAWSQQYLRHPGPERLRNEAAKAALQRSTDLYIDRLARPYIARPGINLSPSGRATGPAYRQQYRRLQQSRYWTRRMLGVPQRFRARPLQPRPGIRW